MGSIEASTGLIVGIAVFIDELLILHSGNGIRENYNSKNI
jgi:hypothetical protein